MGILRAAFDDLGSLIWPAQCPVCSEILDRSGSAPACSCDPLPQGGILLAPRPWPAPVLPVLYGTEIRGPVRRILHAFKYQGLASAREILADRLADVLKGSLPAHELGRTLPAHGIVVPVPTHPVRVRERGWDHTHELARSVARRLKWPVWNALTRRRWTVSLTKLGEWERKTAVAGAIVPNRRAEGIGGEFVLLIDDVVTTAATLTECAGALASADPGCLWAGAGARTPRRERTPW